MKEKAFYRRLLTLLLAMAMTVTPLLAFAEDGEESAKADEQAVESVETEAVEVAEPVEAAEQAEAVTDEDAGEVETAEPVEAATPGGEVLTAELKPAGGKDELMLKSIKVGEDKYFFFPSGVENGKVTYDFDKTAEAYKVMNSSKISSLYITSKDPEKKGMGYVHADKENKAKGTLTMCDENFNQVYSGAIDTLKGRGNTTWGGTDKKSYQVKLDKKADLLDPENGEQKSKKWILLANPFDPTLVRNEIIFSFAKEFGLEASPEGKPVDLYYDGLYRGSYYLCEKVEIGKGRIDIADLEGATEDANPGVDLADLPAVEGVTGSDHKAVYTDGITDPEDISGGYLMELDNVYYYQEKNWFQFGYWSTAVAKSPENMSKAQTEYISSVFDRMFDCVHNGGKMPGSSEMLFDVVDKESFVKFFLVNEWFMNNDVYTSSTFLYKPENDDKLYLGPVWDFDSSMALQEPDHTYKGIHAAGLGARLLKDSDFRKAIKETYKTEMKPLINDYLLGDKEGKYLTSVKNTLERTKDSAAMNYMIWEIDDCGDSYYTADTYEENVKEMLDWLPKRAKWFDSHIMKKSFVTDGIKIGREDPPVVKRLSSKSAKVSFAKIPGATRYQVAYRKAGSSKWSTKIVKGKTYSKYKSLKPGKLYEFKVRAGLKTGKKARYGKYSDITRVYYKYVTPKVTATDAGVDVSWKKVKGASGYELLYSKENSIKGAESVKLSSKTSKYTIEGLEAATEYHIWLRPLKKYKGKTYTGLEKVKSVTTK